MRETPGSRPIHWKGVSVGLCVSDSTCFLVHWVAGSQSVDDAEHNKGATTEDQKQRRKPGQGYEQCQQMVPRRNLDSADCSTNLSASVDRNGMDI